MVELEDDGGGEMGGSLSGMVGVGVGGGILVFQASMTGLRVHDG